MRLVFRAAQTACLTSALVGTSNAPGAGGVGINPLRHTRFFVQGFLGVPVMHLAAGCAETAARSTKCPESTRDRGGREHPRRAAVPKGDVFRPAPPIDETLNKRTNHEKIVRNS